MTMLLTLSTGSLRNALGRKSGGPQTVVDIPAFAIKHLNLHGLNVSASMLAGWSLKDLERLRDRADKAACPCLILIEDTPLSLGVREKKRRQEIAKRMELLAVAANRLGCNALAFHCDAPDTDEALKDVADQIKDVMPHFERMELNVLLASHPGLTEKGDRLTALIKEIGGFRIGSLPSFRAAASAGQGNPSDELRKLAPYAGAILASIDSFDKMGSHKNYNLEDCVSAIRDVGFLNTLAIDYIGNEDPIENIKMGREILLAAIEKD